MNRPPALARLLLRAILPDGVHEPFAGDLEERFTRDAGRSPLLARARYWKDVLSPTVWRLAREARGMPLPPGSTPATGKGDSVATSLLADLKFALRSLRKAPGFTAVAVLSLALGIGPNTAIFSLVDAVLFEEWGVGEPETLVDVYTLTQDGEYFFSRLGTYEFVAEGATDVFEDVAHHSLLTVRIEAGEGEAELALGEMVTGNYFDVMDVPAAVGRTFLPEEDATEGTHPVVVLGHDYWRTRFASDPSVVGGELRLNGRPYTIVGVAPERFRGRLAPGLGTDFWVPFHMYPHLAPDKRGAGDLTISGRVRDGVDPRQALAAVEVLATREDEQRRRDDPEYRGQFMLAAVVLDDVMLHPNFDGILSAIAVLLFVAVALVLLVACVNLAGFLLSRATDRRKEMAVRIAMGAGGGRIVRQLLVESLLLATVGAALGLALGQLALRVFVSIEPPIPIPIELEVGLSWPLLVFTAGTAVVAAVLFGLTPALESTRAPVAATLRDEAGTSGGRRSVGARGALVAVQMAVSTILLVGAALFLRSLQAATSIDLGFETRAAAVVEFQTGANEYSPEEAETFVQELDRRVEGLPGVERVAYTSRMPVGLGTHITTFDIPGVEPPPDQRRHRLEFAAVSPDYFETMEIPILEGRGIEASDREGTQLVTVLSRAAAEQYWPNGGAVGQTLVRNPDGSDALTVVGVAADVKIWSLAEAPRPYMYRAYHQGTQYTSFAVVANGSSPPAEIAALVRQEARTIDPEVFIADLGTMNDHLGYIYFLPRMAAGVLTAVGVLALLLACLGLYGMTSYGVSRRTREMGIRLALGAERRKVIRLVLKSGLVLVGMGGAVGLVGAIILGRAAGRFLVGVSGLDPLSILAAPLVLAAVAGLATYLPARRASRVDPVRALRTE